MKSGENWKKSSLSADTANCVEVRRGWRKRSDNLTDSGFVDDAQKKERDR